MRRIIFHADVNSAFLSWEATYRLHHLHAKTDLREIPSAVGGDQEKRHGIILAKSIPAKPFGIQTGEPVIDAKRKCPDLVIVPPNYSLYERSSKAFLKILSQYSDKIEQYSIDEAFADMTGCTDDPVKTANELREQVKHELGFTINVGVAENKLLAKMASDLKKPDKVHTLWQDEIKTKMWPLPVRDLFYVGPASEKKLTLLGIKTIGELAQTDPDILKWHMKSHGLLIWQYANGIDGSEVITTPPPNKGYGNSLTTAHDVYDRETAHKYLLSLAETVSMRLRADGAKCRVIDVSIRDSELFFYHHQRKIEEATDLTIEIWKEACRCFDELWTGYAIRHLGIHTSMIEYGSFRQMNLFSKVDYEKQKRMETAIDGLRKRFGIDCVMRGRFAPDPKDRNFQIDHMGGGISRERRTVDYSRETIV